MKTLTNGGAVVDLSRSELQKRVFALVAGWSLWCAALDTDDDMGGVSFGQTQS